MHTIIRRNNYDIQNISNDHFYKTNDFSLSTQEPSSPRQGYNSYYTKPSIRQNKEKSQLCNKFMENGYCPYQKRCKFAHGSHELRKNSQLNSKYKTKKCDIYRNQGYCSYGNRCNFIHETEYQLQPMTYSLQIQQIRAFARHSSKLLHLLSSNK